MKKIVVTGMGAISPAGNSPEEMYDSCVRGNSSAKSVEDMDQMFACDWNNTPVKTVCPVSNFDPKKYIESRKVIKRLKPHQLFGVSSSIMAIKDANLGDSIDKSRVSVMTAGGLNGGGVQVKTSVAWNSGYKNMRSTEFLNIIPNTTSFWISYLHGYTGSNWHHVAACASGAQVIISGINGLLLGDCDVAITTGLECQPHPMPATIYHDLKALSPLCSQDLVLADRKKISRPFDVDRTGFVYGGGSGTLVLETEEHAKARGANIYAEIVGWHANNDCYNLVTPDPSANGVTDCMSMAINRAGIEHSEIGYINAHGTATKAGDNAEILAINRVFGDHSLYVSSTKSVMGHCQGAAGALESIIVVKSLQEQLAPPTINLQNRELGADPERYISSATKFDSDYAMSNSFGFGGMNCTLIFKRYSEA